MATEKEWRRTWQPDLLTRPWRPLTSSLHVKTVFSDSSYEILVTDDASLWHERLEGDDVTARSEELNPGVEAPLSTVLRHLQENTDTADTKVKVTGGDELMVRVDSKLASLPYVWKFYMSQLSRDEFAVHVSRPLLVMVAELTRRQRELCALLHRKDREIEDLRAQNVRSSRKHLETGRFDETIFNDNMTSSQEVSVGAGGRGAWAETEELQTSLLMTTAYLKHQPHTTGCGVETEAPSGGASWSSRLPPSITDTSPPTQDSELLRRRSLERRLADEEDKKLNKAKKKKKIKF